MLLTNQQQLESVTEDLEVSKTLKILLMRIINNKKQSKKIRDLARVALEKERLYEQRAIAKRRAIEETIFSRGDIRSGELAQDYAAKV